MADQTFLGSNINLVKLHNLQAILLSLLYEKQLARVQLAKKTSLSTTTITNLISQLISQGIIEETGTQNSSEPRPVGRPQTNLRIIPDARYAIGVHIGIGLARIAIVNLFAEIVHGEIHSFDLKTPPEDFLLKTAEDISNLIDKSKIDRKKILGVGIGASGLVNFETGINLLAPNLNWQNVPIQKILQEALNIPVIVDNNVRAMALGEAYFGIGLGADSLAFVYGRIGVGAGFVVDGNVFRGSNTGAGEIGHTIIVPEGGELCRCGRYGCLETLVSEPAILREAEEIARRFQDGALSHWMQEKQDMPAIERVFEAARAGDQVTRQMIERRAAFLGVALANLVNVLNPELILLGGMFAQGYDLIIPTVDRVMRETAFAGLGEKVRVQTTSFGWRAGVIGASSLALLRFFYQPTQIPNNEGIP